MNITAPVLPYLSFCRRKVVKTALSIKGHVVNMARYKKGSSSQLFCDKNSDQTQTHRKWSHVYSTYTEKGCYRLRASIVIFMELSFVLRRFGGPTLWLLSYVPCAWLLCFIQFWKFNIKNLPLYLVEFFTRPLTFITFVFLFSKSIAVPNLKILS